MIEPGTINGDTFLYPFSKYILWLFSMVSIPPIPEPKLTPALVRSVEESKKPESVIACEAATTPYWINVSNLRDS